MIDVHTELADEIAGYLEQVDGASCDEIAGKLHRRRSDVLGVLREDERFVQTGRYKQTRWNLAGTDSGTDNAALGDAGPTAESPSPLDAGERLQSRCTHPQNHKGNNCHYIAHNGERLCIVCDDAPVPPLLTLEEWMRGEGGEARRQEFTELWARVKAGVAATDERLRFEKAVRSSP